jgi:hypothetical protein
MHIMCFLTSFLYFTITIRVGVCTSIRLGVCWFYLSKASINHKENIYQNQKQNFFLGPFDMKSKMVFMSNCQMEKNKVKVFFLFALAKKNIFLIFDFFFSVLVMALK